MKDNGNDPLDPVARYEFMEARREMDAVRAEASRIHEAQDRAIADINRRLEEKYYTKEGVRDQFKIELSDYRAIKAVLGILGIATIGLVFAVLQQFLINSASS